MAWKINKETWLNPQQEKFAICYSSDQEFYGNWVQSYIEAYQPDTTVKNRYKTACASASQLLSNIKVCKRINELLESEWLNDEFVDKQLLHLITQHWEKSVKLGAIKFYADLKGRVTKKIEHSWSIDTGDLKLMSTEELVARKAAREEKSEKKDWLPEENQYY